MSRLLWATVYLVAVFGAVLARSAHADLIVDVKPISAVGGATIDLTNNRVVVESAGAVITLGIYAQIIGNDQNTTNDGLLKLAGGIISSAPSGPVRGVVGTIGGVTLAPLFTGPLSQIGAQADLDGSGDLDWGSTNHNLVQAGSHQSVPQHPILFGIKRGKLHALSLHLPIR